MTGYPSRAGYVSTYPPADPSNDIVTIDPDKAYQPLMTVMEAARITQNKSTGLVFTCEFPHATPADCSAHTYNRSKYDWIVPQMVHNKLDVVIGGGVSLLTENNIQFLQDEGYGVFLNDITGFKNYKDNRMWALFGNTDMSYDINRDPEQEPSLAEMTQKAIEKLSKNKNGFFLMVEGSKVDWAAHANDAAALITEMLAFDKACGVALDFAKADKKTVVIIVPDHATGGFSIGSSKCPNYSTLTKDELFGILDDNTCFGFTTTGHTGEEVFLALYDPTSNRLTGHHTNIELNQYLRKTMGLKQSLESLTSLYFAKHTDVFTNFSYTISINNEIPILTVSNNNNVLEIQPNTNIVKHNGKEIKLNSVVVYIDKNSTFYLPQSLRKLVAGDK
jgi:alkaline phosphatase